MADPKPKTSLRSVINQVTKGKLAWLDNQRKTLSGIFAPLLEKYEKPENQASLKFLMEIHGTLKKCSTLDNPIPYKTKDLSVFMNWIETEDPQDMIYFGSEELVRHWIQKLIDRIRSQIDKCEYSCLYAKVMTQYMDAANANEDDEIEDDVRIDSELGDMDKFKATQAFTDRVFNAPKDFDQSQFQEFLHTLFNNDGETESLRLLQETRRQVKGFCENFTNTTSDTSDLQYVIDGLLAGDSLCPEKGVTLRELRENEDALGEVATLLTSLINDYKNWTWPEAIQVDFRRDITGRYRAFMDEDIITAIFLHYVGARWGIFLKGQFKKIHASKIWKRGTDTVGDLYYNRASIEGYRRELHQQVYLSILPSQMSDLSATAEIYEDDPEGHNKSALSPMNIKHKLHQMVSNEIQLNNILRPGIPLTIVQADMERFGPSLIHEAVITVMKFFGVTEDWIIFFRTFLETTIKMESPSAPVQIRKKGAPLSHTLSTLLGESILFIMDLHMNQSSGLPVFRIYDDFWFWHHNSEKIVKAWEAMSNYTKLAGLTLNSDKSASVICSSELSPNEISHGPEPLPQNRVKWGFIILHSDGTYRISQELLEPHVIEMHNCLKKAETVMHWINIHNKYLRFFIRNCAEPALILGKQHVVQIMTAVKNILKQVHPETKGDSVKALKNKFPEVFGDKQIMDSWFHWPVQQGGLSLYNPFLELIPLHEAYRKRDEEKAASGHSSGPFGEMIDKDNEEWKSLLKSSKERRQRRAAYTDEDIDEDTISDFEVSEKEADVEREENMYRVSFLSDGVKEANKKTHARKRIGFDTWVERYRETSWSRWRAKYCNLFSNYDTVKTNESGDWGTFLYSGQMKEKLGGNSSFVDSNLVPVSLITAMQGTKVHKN